MVRRNEIRLSLTFSAAFTGSLHLYALDWDNSGRRETISVGSQSIALSSDFSQGAWVAFPITATAGQTITIVVDHTAGPNAVLSGIFLGESGTTPPPTPPPPRAATRWCVEHSAGRLGRHVRRVRLRPRRPDRIRRPGFAAERDGESCSWLALRVGR